MLYDVGQTPTQLGAALSYNSPPPMMDWRSVTLRAADPRAQLKGLIPTEPQPSIQPLEFAARSFSVVSEGFFFSFAEGPRQLC